DLQGEATEIDVRLDRMAVVARTPARSPGCRGIGDETMRRAFPCGLEPAAKLAGGVLVDGAERLRPAAVERAFGIGDDRLRRCEAGAPQRPSASLGRRQRNGVRQSERAAQLKRE